MWRLRRALPEDVGPSGGGSIIKGASWAANWKGWADTKLFLRTGDSADGIPKGAIVLLEPLAPKASGHVGFFHSLKKGNKIVLLGGNQSGKVCLRAFPRGKLVAIRWLAAVPKTDAPADDTPVTSGGPVTSGSTPGSGSGSTGGSTAGGGTQLPPVAGATNQDVLTLARTLFGEARGEFDADGRGDVPVEAVANVILNRAAKKFRGKATVHGVCRDPLQFSCWNGNDANRAKIMNSRERGERRLRPLPERGHARGEGRNPRSHARRAALPRHEHRQAAMGGEIAERQGDAEDRPAHLLHRHQVTCRSVS